MDNNKQIIVNLPSNLDLGPKALQLLHLRFEHPEYTQAQLGDNLGISQQRVCQILNHPKVKALLPKVSRSRVVDMIPKATKRYESLIDSKNEFVAERSAARILTENKVFDVPETKTTVEVTLKTVQELQNIVDRAKDAPGPVIDAEVVKEE